MIREALSHLDLSVLSEISLVIFFVVFVACSAWALLRPKRQVTYWSGLALDEGCPDYAAVTVAEPEADRKGGSQ